MEKSPNVWKLNYKLLNNIQVKEKISKEIRNYFEQNENAMYQSLWDATKVVLRGKYIVLETYIWQKIFKSVIKVLP